jgi:dTDP-4-dehydrorhamnose 3,5-epimerase
MVWAPAGFARGFCALSVAAEIQYKCTGLYNSKAEAGILWNDPKINIEWPLSDVIVSPKDSHAATLDEWLASPESDNFYYSPGPESQVSIGSHA